MSRTGDKRPFAVELQRRRHQGHADKAPVEMADLMSAILALHADVLALGQGLAPEAKAAAKPDAPAPNPEADALRSRMDQERAEVRMLKIELNALAHSIETTKKEIALLVAETDKGDRLSTVTDELDSVVEATENATDTILDHVERMANLAAEIQSQEQDSYIRRLADEIQELTVGVFEACNFQDLTGQRITKVVNTMKYVEQRVDRMMAIWGRDTFRDLPFEPEETRAADTDKRLLNGPQDKEAGISQDEIDLLFG
ncbi:protein phosphatase CheZ [Pararhodospirillum oryzae]|uniref:Uncharacterized protein n=1 Tax=Pararhodospirillum oryzae TaxID=478448 RepID=A0A512HBA8_9PROT|nr:protein phosphatase CheZ [Pararhodospirillum oryzae]GEO82729.1 hypothetical protein ROR02_28600 [Pararhodospirillum oryzae]